MYLLKVESRVVGIPIAKITSLDLPTRLVMGMRIWSYEANNFGLFILLIWKMGLLMITSKNF